MEPQDVEKWAYVLRDLAPALVGIMLFVAQIFWLDPNALLVGAGLTLLAPIARRIDLLRREQRQREDDDDDIYDGPGGYYRNS